jgi:RND family efflux transporter MFP subunit
MAINNVPPMLMMIGRMILLTLLAQTLTVAAWAASAEIAVHLQGVVMPAQKIKLSFSQSGIIREMAGGGSIVVAGGMVGKLDDSKARSQLKQSAAQYRSAISELASMKHSRDKSARLVEDSILSEVALTEADFTVVAAKERLIVAKAQLELAEAALAECVVNAPFKGAVIAKHVSTGEWANAGEPFIEFVNLEELSLSIDIPPDMILGLSLGLTTDVMDKGRIVGQASVKTIYPVIDPASGLRRIVWQVVPVKGVLLTGRYVSLAAWSAISSDQGSDSAIDGTTDKSAEGSE